MDFRKTIRFVILFVLAAAGPITLFTASDFAKKMQKSWLTSPFAGAAATGTASSPTSATASQSPTTPTAAIPAEVAAISAVPMPSIDEALSFDVTIDWVLQHWPRVTTGLVRVQMQGYRVPLATGTAPTDLAGSLTYYFNPHQHVAQITFRGVTGDASALVAFLTTHYNFTRRMTNDPSLILYETVNTDNRLSGIAKIHAAKVIRASQPYNHFEVDLTITRPEQ
jgi:hypothetical protein